MRLEDNIRKARQGKDILLMTHLVLGYPSFAANREVIRGMVAAGVDLIELQIPFSEPMADGPVILKANQRALASGTRVADCFAFAEEMVREHPIPFLFMTYYNILYKHGVAGFIEKAAAIGIQGLIVPDLPPEEGGEFLRLARERDIAPILIFAPTSTDERMRLLGGAASGFVYCVARRGVTGASTAMDTGVTDYLRRCRQATSLPLAVGFGISSREDVDFLKGKADIAVIGTRTIRLIEEEGTAAVTPFIAGLR
ncbi:MAG: tryptophan synthase subunit alpha [Thermodesulfobacteriota bacterium]